MFGGEQGQQYSNDFIAEQLYSGLGMERAEIDLEIGSMEQVVALNKTSLTVSIRHVISISSLVVCLKKTGMLPSWNES